MEYLNLYLLTFNCARTPIDVDLFTAHFFDALPNSASNRANPNFEAPELIVLCLEEIAPIAYAFLGGSYLAPYFKSFDRVVDQAVSKRWDTRYVNVVTENVGMTGLMVYARSDVTDKVSWIDTAQVGLGFLEMGNKGAVGARLGYRTNDQGGETMDLTFIAAHLAPMEYAFEQRNDDWRSIVERLVFARQRTESSRRSIGAGDDSEERAALLRDSTDGARNDDQSMFSPTTYLFLGGDLNYRTSNTGPTETDHTRFPRPITDTASPVHYSQLLKGDQLIREMGKAKCFHGLSEAPIDFPPTYKYTEPGQSNDEWKWAKRRWPSWCDRILYLDSPSWMTRIPRITTHVYDALPVFATSDHRAVALSASVPLKAIQVPDDVGEVADVRLAAPFRLDPGWQQRRNTARTKEIVVGIVAYLGLTWEGNALLIASVIGLLGLWLVLRSVAA